MNKLTKGECLLALDEIYDECEIKYPDCYEIFKQLINEHFDNPPLSFTKNDLVKIKLSLENTVNEYRSELRNIEMSEVMKNAHVKRMNQYEEVLKKVEDEIERLRS